MSKEGIGKEFTGVVIAFACHDNHGNLLLAKRSLGARDEHERWEFPAGGLKFGETAESALAREIQEEFCVQIKQKEFLGYRDLLRTDNGVPTHWVALDFLVEIDPTNVQIGEPHKCDEIRWVKFGQWPEPLHSQFSKFVDKHEIRLRRL